MLTLLLTKILPFKSKQKLFNVTVKCKLTLFTAQTSVDKWSKITWTQGEIHAYVTLSRVYRVRRHQECLNVFITNVHWMYRYTASRMGFLASGRREIAKVCQMVPNNILNKIVSWVPLPASSSLVFLKWARYLMHLPESHRTDVGLLTAVSRITISMPT